MDDRSKAPPAPIGLLAELTHRCPLRCPYCSNPLGLERRSARFREAVVSAATVVEVGVRTPGGFFEEALILEASDRGVEGAWSELHRAVGLFLDGLADEISVAVSGGQGEEDLIADGRSGARRVVWHVRRMTSSMDVLVGQSDWAEGLFRGRRASISDNGNSITAKKRIGADRSSSVKAPSPTSPQLLGNGLGRLRFGIPRPFPSHHGSLRTAHVPIAEQSAPIRFFAVIEFPASLMRVWRPARSPCPGPSPASQS